MIKYLTNISENWDSRKLFELNLCKYIYEEEKDEFIDGIYFEKIWVDNNKVLVSNFNDLQKLENSLEIFSSYLGKNNYCYCYITIETQHKLTTELKENNIVNGLFLSENFTFNGEELSIEFCMGLQGIEGELEGFEKFRKKEELLVHLSNENIGKKRWLNFTKLEKKCWLDFAYFRMNERGEPLSLNITVDGKYLLCEEDVYCYFGEEVYGVLGYLGYNFNAFADVLWDFPLKVKWINFQYSKDNFESKEDYHHLDDFIEVLKKYSSLEISY
ncbi:MULTISPECIES: hypothetical protein [Acinetobacter]|uniref:Barstar (barnase inhibitor) domain-containing protein n=1 Tax=Acinetobacter genomosp. 33YU TaxID=1675530 RepID=A0A1V2V210_9GAMM|nr:hypothetical protein [Acinetobacter genomosp. 33YU]MDB0281641.1 hypothetical protein [Acinetobacter seifertii]ONN56083.1 hypothetical protein AC058_00045 [Acinetobacter genomosp. 33YU]